MTRPVSLVAVMTFALASAACALAPAVGWLPVQIEQVETKKDEVITLKLVEAPALGAG